MTLDDYLGRLRQVVEEATLWQLMVAAFEGRGAAMVSYRHLQEDPDTEPRPCIIHAGFPEEFVEFFFGEALYRDNPVVDHALRTTEPFYWSDTDRLVGLTATDRAILGTMMEMLQGDGLIIQVFGPNRRVGTVNLGLGPVRGRWSAAEVAELQIMAQTAHLVYCRLVGGAEAAEVARLTGREREVLEWIARGKSNAVIADILGISVHTVDTHVRRIFRKLEVNDRTTAAVKGFGASLVQAAA